MTDVAAGDQGVLARIAAVKAEFEIAAKPSCAQAVQAHLQEVDCSEDTGTPSADGTTGELEQLREAVNVMESASETYEERKKCLEVQNAQMLSEIQEFECIRSNLKKIVQEETALLAEQECEDPDLQSGEARGEGEKQGNEDQLPQESS